jgi:hypothetical protein
MKMADNPSDPGPGADDCYNRVTDACNAKHPGKDWGDAEYRQCINDGLDWCDTHEPNAGAVVVPGFNRHGRLVKLNAFDKFYIKVFRR